jgi:D-arabinose 1-dehydrogenase-like Zn-dependent alcohol dehydrogenase
MPPAELSRVFFLQLRIIGSTMGSLDELNALARLCDTTDVRPVIDSVMPLTEARTGFERMEQGEAFGKVVFTL